MKNVLLLLLVVGLLVGGWLNRDTLTGMVKSRSAGDATEEVPPPEEPAPTRAPTAAAAPTPHPAKEAQIAATQAYPALNNPNSPFNKKFLALYAEAQQNDPQLLTQSNWPLKLADRTAVALGGAPMPVPNTPAPVRPSGLQGSALDQHLKKKKPQ